MATIESYPTADGKLYRVRYRMPDRRQTSKRGFSTQRDAERFLSGVEVSKDRGEWVDPTKSRITLTAWAEKGCSAQVQFKPTTRLDIGTALTSTYFRDGGRQSWVR